MTPPKKIAKASQPQLLGQISFKILSTKGAPVAKGEPQTILDVIRASVREPLPPAVAQAAYDPKLTAAELAAVAQPNDTEIAVYLRASSAKRLTQALKRR